MTSAAMHQMHLQHVASARGHYAQGWTVSFVFHGLIIAGAMLLLSDLKLVPQPEPFKWDVALVQQRPADAPPSPAPKPPAPNEQTVQPTQRTATRSVERRPIVQQIQKIQSVQRVVHQEVREGRPTVQAAPEHHQTASPQESVPLKHETVVRPKHEPVVRETVADATPMTANPLPREPLVSEAPQETSAPVETSSPAPPIEASGVPDATTVAKPAPVERQAAIHEAPVQARPAARADYSWLAEALWSRVERMKRYPYLARMNRWEGKVVVEAVIREDGHVLHLKVTQTSGYAVLDKDAMEVVQKASPLTLKHPLGQPQVVVQVPISYRLER